MQLTTLGYLVVKLAGTASLASLYVGFLGASAAIPVVLLSPLAGVVADRFPRRRVLLITTSISVLSALTLGILVGTHAIALWSILTLEAIRAATQAFDAPARQSWVPLLVPPEAVGNAIGLNSIAFNAPSVIGPPIAGYLILSVGLPTAFYLNAVLTLAVVLAVANMQPVPPSSRGRESVLASIAAGFRFLMRHPVLSSVVLVLAFACVFVRPYVQMLPAYAKHVVGVDASGLGVLLASTGAGALVGSMLTAVVANRWRGRVWFASSVLMPLGTIALGFVHDVRAAIPVLAVEGFAVLSFAGSSNVLLQTLSPAEMRGRAISVFSMIILGLVPAGSLAMGALASAIGLSHAISAFGVVSLAVAVTVYLRNGALRRI